MSKVNNNGFIELEKWLETQAKENNIEITIKGTVESILNNLHKLKEGKK